MLIRLWINKLKLAALLSLFGGLCVIMSYFVSDIINFTIASSLILLIHLAEHFGKIRLFSGMTLPATIIVVTSTALYISVKMVSDPYVYLAGIAFAGAWIFALYRALTHPT